MYNSCYRTPGIGVGFIGSVFARLLTSKELGHVLQHLSASLSLPGHHTLERNHCFILTTPRCASWAWARSLGVNLLGITILLPQRINLPITHSSLHTRIYFFCWSPFQFLFSMHWRNSTNSLSSDEVTSISRIVMAWEVVRTATNLTNSSGTLCDSECSACSSARSRRDNGLTAFCFPGKYLIINAYGFNRKTHLQIHAHGFDQLE